MNKMFKILAAIALLAVSQMASAICYTNLNQVPSGSPGLFMRDGAFCTENRPANEQGFAVPQGQVFQHASGGQQVFTTQPQQNLFVLQSLPTGYTYRACTDEEEINRGALLTLKGALAGVLIGDSGRAAGKGAGAGLLYSVGTECKVAVQQVSNTQNSSNEILGQCGSLNGERVTKRICDIADANRIRPQLGENFAQKTEPRGSCGSLGGQQTTKAQCDEADRARSANTTTSGNQQLGNCGSLGGRMTTKTECDQADRAAGRIL